ncbi:MAG: 3-deoxy-7-phosphoheptulonate synthase [Acidobacteriota bacterium]|jgi:3-deoxy-7-phosphoheptulonate synthase|nr:3-deoxy-7-phosphoheptulonate synthase [Acidobacteriota bacterium]
MRVLRLQKTLSEPERIEAVKTVRAKFPDAEPLGSSAFLRIDAAIPPAALEEFTAGCAAVCEIIDDVPPYALCSRKLSPLYSDDSGAVDVCGVAVGDDIVGGRSPVVIAGPCAVESYEQMARIADNLVTLGVRFMRAGAYKPRTNPYSFRGLKKHGLEIMDTIKRRFGLKMVTEVMSGDKIDEVSEVADILQVGSRNMFHYALLDRLGAQPKPVLLKRGMAAGMDEFLLAAEYILMGGNRNVILCERGIKTFETATRNTLDLNVVPHIKQKSHLPIIVDPSHGAGVRSLVRPMSLAALACGADGIIVEVHHDPDHAMSDGQQSITPAELLGLLEDIDRMVSSKITRFF